MYLVYLYPCLGLSPFILYLCDLFLIFSLIFFVINQITSFKQVYLFFVHLLYVLLLDFLQIQPCVAYKGAYKQIHAVDFFS